MSDERPGWHRHPNGGGWVEDTATVDETAYVGPDARVYGAARVSGNAEVFGAAQVSAPRHVLTVGPIGSEDQTLTLFRAETGYWVSVGCWRPDGATLDDLTAEVQRRAPDHADEYEAAMALCRVRIAEWEKR